MLQSPTISPSSQQIDTSQQSTLLAKLNNELISLTKSFQQQKSTKSSLSKRLRQLLQERQFYQNQRLVQQRKYKSLNLLINELQSSYQKLSLQSKSKQLLISEDEDNKVALQNHLLREQLIKLNQSIKEDEILYQYMKQLDVNKNALSSFIKRSSFIQAQAQTMAELRSSIDHLQNENFECRRKWELLRKEKEKQQNDLKVYKIQSTRQVEMLKTMYEEYLQNVNMAKTKIVNFNDTKRQKLLTQYMVYQVAIIQQRRQSLQDQNKNLHYHLSQLQQQHAKIIVQNTELNSFFMNQNRSQQSRLATKMKQRIEQLKDGLLEMEARNSLSSIMNKRNSTLQYVREKLMKYKQANDFLQMKQQQINDGKFSSLDEKEISEFFSIILKQKEQKCQLITERNQQMNVEIKELSMRMLLLESQVGNLEEIIKENDVEREYKRREFLKR